MNVTVALQASAGPSLLASASFTVNGNWTQHPFTLTPRSGTGCVDGAGDPAVMCGNGKEISVPGHICVKCGGEFVQFGAILLHTHHGDLQQHR